MSDLGLIGIRAHIRYFVPGFHISGVVKDRTGALCQRAVVLKTRPTVTMLASTFTYYGISNHVTGRFDFFVASKQLDKFNCRYVLEIMPMPEETDLNAIVFDHIIPT